MKKTFKNAKELKDYIKKNEPSEIWLDDFSKDIPYIIINHYHKGIMHGKYNNQIFLTHYVAKSDELFEKGMYVKE